MLAGGERYTESYDKLIYCPGARPVVPEGGRGEGCFTLRTVEDAFAIDDYIKSRRPATAIVAGGGFIGLEAAENLAARGIKVTLVQGGRQVLPQVDYDMACFLHAELRKNGVELRLSSRVTSIEGGKEVTVHTAGGDFSADMCIVALACCPIPDLRRRRDSDSEQRAPSSPTAICALPTPTYTPRATRCR